MNKFVKGASVAALATVFAAGTAYAANFSQGFKTDTAGWNDFSGGTIVRVPSGDNGITSHEGDYHAVVDGPVYTQWGGYESTFPTDGYQTSVAVYLDMDEADGSDKRFDFSSAINNPSGDHRRDFIFHLGTVPGSTASGEWAVSASNNAPGWPLNPNKEHIIIDESGWYTLRHTFTDNGSGILTVDLDVLDESGIVLGTWTLSDDSDVIGTTVGGNRYGWFTSQRFDLDSLAIDSSEKVELEDEVVVGPPTTKDECKKDGWKTFNNPTFKNQGQCVSSVVTADAPGKNK